MMFISRIFFAVNEEIKPDFIFFKSIESLPELKTHSSKNAQV